MMRKANLITIYIILLLSGTTSCAVAQTDVYLKLSTSERRPIELVVSPIQAQGKIPRETVAKVKEIIDVLSDDLAFSLYFQLIEPPDSDPGYGFKKGQVLAGSWQLLGAKMLLIPELRTEKKQEHLKIRIYDLGVGRDIFTKQIVVDHSRGQAHRICDEIIKTLTGENGVASTRIAFCQKHGQNKELAVLDYDGHNLQKLTALSTINLSPDWSPDGSRLAFISFQRNRTEIYSLDMRAWKLQAISQVEGLNTSPAWSPDGKKMALTLSRDGNAEIYLYTLDSRSLQRLTNSWAIDCSPGWSPNGRELVFTSDRPGSPQIYLMDADGSNIRRLTYQGNYNTSPVWSPKGDKIAFVSRINGLFQICAMNVTGDGYTQLTYEGDNEDPSWSPDGLHLAFSSSRTGSSQLWLMHWDGSGQKAVTNLSGALMPAWSPFPPTP
ncbi:TPA: Tol-Pal system beta propeller repeat protein TolB [Candidatus Edwardsbacteria bacterium]|jgi:TolB protein|nr:Tol-Pal system beta propeller repeat protein TolB [Candidatus Edwardsbacteria bacterium]HBZ86943.1 Tol-Pal system beta propeller repeat protein TolB [Candidatus Edwardsbacteria bacterium]